MTGVQRSLYKAYGKALAAIAWPLGAAKAEKVNKAVAATGPTVKTTVVRTTEEVPIDSSERAPEFWSYVESILGDWGDHTLWVYRDEPKMQGPYSSEPTYIDRSFDGTISMPNGTSVPFSADAIKEKFGGRVFRFILKKGNQRVTQARLATEAAPRYPEMNPGASSPLPNAGQYTQGGDPTAQVANRAIDAMQNREPEAMRLAMDLLRSSSEMMKQHYAAPSGKSGVQETLELIAALKQSGVIETSRPKSLVEELAQLKELRELFAPTPSNSLKDTIEFIGALKTSGLVNIGGGRGGLWEIAASALPQVVGGVTESLREWRMGMEAQSRAILAQRGQPQPNPPAQLPPAQPADIHNSISQDAAAAPSAAAGQPSADMSNAAPPLEWIETRIAAILKDLGSTVDEQVDRVLDFLELSNPELIAGLLNPPSIHPTLPAGEKGILMLFQNRPILETVPVNARLTDFIRKFVAKATAEFGQATQSLPAAGPPGPQPVPSPQKPA